MPAETSDFSAINSTWQNMLSAMRGDTLIIRATHKPGQVSRQVSASHEQVRSGQREPRTGQVSAAARGGLGEYCVSGCKNHSGI